MSPGPSARTVDWALFAVVLLQAGSGSLSILAGRPEWAWLFWLHGIGGIVLVGLVGLKLWRVRDRLRARQWRRDTVFSVLAAIVVLGAIATGVVWASGWRPWVGPWTLLTIHALLGLALVPPLLLHLSQRVHRPRRVDFADRRTAIQFAVLAGVGVLAWRVQKWLTYALEVPARFTGSYQVDSFEGNAFPTTSWVADDPDPVEDATWTLVVDGAVATPLELGTGDLETTAEHEAILDCTSGWYSNQRWEGVAVASLLETAQPTAAARWVSFHSVTGYRWSLPIEEAREAMLATHVTAERLSHGHGYPLRLVAPGRRGFQWVKWVERVEVRTQADLGQWVAIFTSGFD